MTEQPQCPLFSSFPSPTEHLLCCPRLSDEAAELQAVKQLLL